MKKIKLIIEKGKDCLFGRVKYEDNLIVDEAANEIELRAKITNLLFHFHDLRPTEFEFVVTYE